MTACALLIACGCQQTPTTTVSGTVTLDGKVLSIESNERGTIVFQSVGGQGTTATGVLDSGGRFKLGTGASWEVAPGKYQVAVSVVQLLPKTEGAEQGAKRITPTKYASVDESGLQVDVNPGENEFDFKLIQSADETNVNSPNAMPGSSESDGPQSPQSSAVKTNKN
jgi:hypothetical protein